MPDTQQGTGFDRVEVQSESVGHVGPHPATRCVRCLEDERLESLTNELAGAGQSRHSGADDEYVCIGPGNRFGHQPRDVGPPLNGPVRSLVIQPP